MKKGLAACFIMLCFGFLSSNGIIPLKTINTSYNQCPSYDTVNAAIGIITISESYHFGDTLFIMDNTGQAQETLVLIDENQELSLPCLSMDKAFFKVQTDIGTIGYLDRSNAKVKFQTWQEHILSVFAVAPIIPSDHVFTKPDTNSNPIHYDKDLHLHPFQIQGDWIKVSFGYENNTNSGWIRWKKDEKLLIELLFFA